MARKLNVSKPPNPENGAPETSNHRSEPAAVTLYLMQLREQALKISLPDSIRLEINDNAVTEEPEPVKIIWIDDNK